MNIVETIKNAVVPDTASNQGPVQAVSGDFRPENDIPGAFPDSDDEQEAERQDQRTQASLARKQRDSGVDAGEGQDPTWTTLPDRTKRGDAKGEEPLSRHASGGDRGGPVLSAESLGLSPDKHEIPRASISHHRETDAARPGQVGSPEARGEEGEPALGEDNPVVAARGPQNGGRGDDADAGASIPPSSSDEQPDFAMADKQTTTTQVRPQHLGNEGTTPPARSPATGGEEAERERGQPLSGDVAVQEYPGASSSNEPAPSTTGSRSRNPIAEADSASESLGQYSGTGSGAVPEIGGNGGIRNGVLGRGSSHVGSSPSPSPSSSALPPQDDRAPASPTATRDGGVHNTVLGHGSEEHPYAYGQDDAESPQERRPRSSASSGKSRTGADAVISGVSDSGLGLGGVHNGVVGHGSHDEEDARHRTSS